MAGNAAPSPADSVYLKVEGTNVPSTVGVVTSTFVEQLTKTSQEFLGGLVFPYTRGETSEVTFETQGGRHGLVATEHGFQLISAGQPPILADRTLVDLIFFQLARTKIEHYLDKALPGATLTLSQASPEQPTHRAELGAPCPHDELGMVVAHKIAPDEITGCVSRSIMTALMTEPERLKARTPTVLNPDEIDHVIVEREDAHL